MNERLTIQDLTDLLAAKHGMTKKDAEAFVKEFFLLIEEALENETYVKIKGLGTFKLVEVDNRESVKVSTGERFQIKGHTKVSFTPDTNLKDTINKPFAHFETVVLKEGTVLDNTPVDEGEEEDTGEEDLMQIAVNEGNTVQEEAISDVPVIEEPIIEESEVQEPVVEIETLQETIEPEEEQSSPDIITEDTAEEQSEVLATEKQPEIVNEKAEYSAEQIIARELQEANLRPEMLEVRPRKIKSEKDTTVVPRNEKSPVPYLITIIIIVLLLCGSAILFIYYPDLFSSAPDKDALEMPVATQPTPVQPEALIPDSIERKDTVKETTPEVLVEPVKTQTVVTKEAVKDESKTNRSQVAAPAYLDSATYTITGTKATHTVKEGETLTRVALHYYGTKAMWPYIVKHNPKVIKNPNNVPYGTTIKIPELTKK